MALPGRPRCAALIAISAAAAIAAWMVMATGPVDTGYARSGQLAAPAGSAAPAATRPADPVPAPSGAVSGTPPRQLIVPDLIAVVPAGITTAQVNTIGALPGVRAVLAVDGGQVTINGQMASVLGVPQAFRSWTPPVTAAASGIWSRLAGGQLITGGAAASRLGLRAGSSYQVSAATRELVPFGAAALLDMPGVDAIVNRDLSARLGLAANVAALINAPAADLATLMSQVRSVIGAPAPW